MEKIKQNGQNWNFLKIIWNLIERKSVFKKNILHTFFVFVFVYNNIAYINNNTWSHIFINTVFLKNMFLLATDACFHDVLKLRTVKTLMKIRRN